VEPSKLAIRYPFKMDKLTVATSNLAIRYPFKNKAYSGKLKARKKVPV